MPSFPSTLKIGHVEISPATVLAPMAGVTDTVFRRFIRGLGGCGLIMTEFTSSHGVSASRRAKKGTRTLKYLAFDPDSPGSHRRSVYRFLFRTVPDPLMDALDCPDGSQFTAVRSSSMTAGLWADRPTSTP